MLLCVSYPLPQAAADAAATAALGPPAVVRQLTRVADLACISGAEGGSVPLPQPITVRIHLSGSSSTGSAASADTALAGVAAAAPDGPRGSVPRLQARLRALEAMSRRVAQAQQTIVRGVPTPLPSRQAAADAAQQAARQQAAAAAAAQQHARSGMPNNSGGGLASPTAGRLPGSAASGLHRLARGSAAAFSPFQHKRPHPADSEASSSSSGSSSSGGWLAGCAGSVWWRSGAGL